MIPPHASRISAPSKDLRDDDPARCAHRCAVRHAAASPHTFILAVPAHLADAITEAVSVIVEAATDPARRERDFDIATEW